MPKADILGISPEQAEKWADEVASRFDAWFGDKKCLRDETNNGYQFQRFIEILFRRDGEYFIRFHYSSRRSLLNPLQLSIVDPTQILGYGLTDTHGFNQSYHDGIIRDKGGKEIGYKVMVLTPKGYQEKIIPAIGARSGRRFMLHGYQAEYPGQGRGMSELAHAVQDYSNITGFSQAQIIKAISQSQYNFKTVPSKDAPASNPTETQVGFGYDNQFGAPVSAEASSDIAQIVYSRLPEVISTVPGATGLFGLQAGEDFEAIKNTAPVEQFAAFVDAYMTYLSASHSMPIEVQTMRFGRSYTGSMGALILFWRVAEIGRHEQKSDWLDPVYEAWMSEEIAAGNISASGWSDPLMRAAWLNAKWGGAPMPIIDPAKQSKADKENVELGAQHLDDVARNHNGSNGQLNRAKLQRQLTELPIPPWSKGVTAPVNPMDESSNDSEEED
jgi:capsid protein